MYKKKIRVEFNGKDCGRPGMDQVKESEGLSHSDQYWSTGMCFAPFGKILRVNYFNFFFQGSDILIGKRKISVFRHVATLKLNSFPCAKGGQGAYVRDLVGYGLKGICSDFSYLGL